RALEISERRLHELLAHRESVIDETRSSLAREIHDEIGGTLSALHFDLAWIARNGDARSADRASLAMDTLSRVMQCAQRIQRDLRPPVLDDGLVQALRWQIDEFRRRTGLVVAFDSNVDLLPLAGEAAMTVFRTLQESLTNIGKHARASAVAVDLVVRGDQMSLEISDDGIGIGSQDLGKPASFGLRGLAERARRVGGWIDVAPGVRGGTCVLLSMPMPTGDAACAPRLAVADFANTADT
ncbi:MAG TPA: histidine kinase, partial [Burkholderiaceae bacterium]|nr:histidine kinase [Burkholderiaceae bacterium]